MVLLLVLGPLLLPESRDPDAGRLDLVSAALSLAAILATVYGIKQFAEDGRGTQPAAWVLAGLVLGAVFVRRQRTLPYPLVDLDLFRNPVFSAALSTQALAVAAVAGPFFVISQFMQLVLGLSPLQAGLWALPGTIAGAAGPLLAPVLARRFRPAYVVAGGLVIAAAGAAVLTQVQADSGLAAVVIGHALLSFGIGPALTITVDMLIGAAPPARAGAASAISETSIELGNALGIALLGSVGIAIYRAALSDSVPAGVPLEAADAARDTIGGAVGVAPTLPPTLATQLLGTARAAFTDALQVTAGVSAAVVLALAVLAAALLRRASTEPVPSEPAERPARDARRLEPQSGTSGSTQ
jgi:DHA2 family multidrug resistance protein-like MFS transporter